MKGETRLDQIALLLSDWLKTGPNKTQQITLFMSLVYGWSSGNGSSGRYLWRKAWKYKANVACVFLITFPCVPGRRHLLLGPLELCEPSSPCTSTCLLCCSGLEASQAFCKSPRADQSWDGSPCCGWGTQALVALNGFGNQLWEG